MMELWPLVGKNRAFFINFGVPGLLLMSPAPKQGKEQGTSSAVVVYIGEAAPPQRFCLC